MAKGGKDFSLWVCLLVPLTARCSRLQRADFYCVTILVRRKLLSLPTAQLQETDVLRRRSTTNLPVISMHVSALHLALLQLAALLMMVSAECGLRTGEFVAAKAQNGSILCATSTPDNKMSVRSKLDCYRNCLAEGCSCASGANYRAKEKLCETYGAEPTEFQVVSDCSFYQHQVAFLFHSQ